MKEINFNTVTIVDSSKCMQPSLLFDRAIFSGMVECHEHLYSTIDELVHTSFQKFKTKDNVIQVNDKFIEILEDLTSFIEKNVYGKVVWNQDFNTVEINPINQFNDLWTSAHEYLFISICKECFNNSSIAAQPELIQNEHTYNKIISDCAIIQIQNNNKSIKKFDSVLESCGYQLNTTDFIRPISVNYHRSLYQIPNEHLNFLRLIMNEDILNIIDGNSLKKIIQATNLYEKQETVKERWGLI